MPETEQSPQAERRQREEERRKNRATTPPLGSPFSTQVVGVTKQDGYPQTLIDMAEVRAVTRPMWLTLKREPDNSYDENAIAVHWDGHKIGHLNKIIALRMAPEIDTGTEWLCRVEEVTGEDDLWGVSIRCKRED